MKRGLLLMCSAAFLLQAQDVVPQSQSPQAPPRLFDWNFSNFQANQVRTDWSRQMTQNGWHLVNVIPNPPMFLPPLGDSVCAVPLLVAPVDPNIDAKMPLNPPKMKRESAGIVKTVPVCPGASGK